MSIPRNIPCDSILDSIADGVFTVDLDWNITSFNKAATQITGISQEEALGQKCWEVFHSSLCDGACALSECIRGNRKIVNKSIFIIRPDEQRVPISISTAPLFGKDGRLIGGVETFRDLSAIHLMRREIEKQYTFEDIVSKSPALNKIFQILPQIARSGSTVLITGESGTGKELFARALHNLSPRQSHPLITVNCGALPEQLLESELFGYKAGAFTDAKRDKPGRFDLAQGGTIFLDEVGDLPLRTQVKLLRVLQERLFEPLGGVESVKADVRIIAATNRDLGKLVAEGRFRQDLYYRLNVVQIHLPPLCERPEDIPLLVTHFVERFNTLQGKNVFGVSDDVMSILMRHSFPGNVRELENILEYAFILCSQGFIQVEGLPESLQHLQKNAHVPPRTLEEIKCQAVQDALWRNQGKKMRTCRELGISKDTLRRMLRKCGETGEK